MGLVELGDGTEASAASGILNVVSNNHTSELLNLRVVLPLERVHGLSETSDTASEGGLRRAEGSLGIKLGTTSGSREGMVGSLLGLLVLGKGGIQSISLAGQGTLGVGTIATHLLADLADLGEEAVGKPLHASSSLSLVTGHEAAQLLVLLKVLLVASITDLHH